MARSFELFNLEGRIALITGSSQGIGFALARGLAEHGATVIINGRDRNKVDSAVTVLEQDGFQSSRRCLTSRMLKKSARLSMQLRKKSVHWIF